MADTSAHWQQFLSLSPRSFFASRQISKRSGSSSSALRLWVAIRTNKGAEENGEVRLGRNDTSCHILTQHVSFSLSECFIKKCLSSHCETWVMTKSHQALSTLRSAQTGFKGQVQLSSHHLNDFLVVEKLIFLCLERILFMSRAFVGRRAHNADEAVIPEHTGILLLCWTDSFLNTHIQFLIDQRIFISSNWIISRLLIPAESSQHVQPRSPPDAHINTDMRKTKENTVYLEHVDTCTCITHHSIE